MDLLVIHADALADIEQAADWYDQQEQDLGSDLSAPFLRRSIACRQIL
jgi:hypothetical protein